MEPGSRDLTAEWMESSGADEAITTLMERVMTAQPENASKFLAAEAERLVAERVELPLGERGADAVDLEAVESEQKRCDKDIEALRSEVEAAKARVRSLYEERQAARAKLKG